MRARTHHPHRPAKPPRFHRTAVSQVIRHALVGGLAIASPWFAAVSHAAEPSPSTTPAADVTLPAVKVRGAGEPARGYVAQQSLTGTKSDTPLAETPQSMTVITRDRLDDLGASSLTDVLPYVAGVQAEPYGLDPRVDRYSIRGFDASAYGLYLDGLQLPSLGDPDRSFRIDPYGAERVEVLRGPASVLYGNGSVGGLINVVSKRPTKTTLREIEVDAGSFERRSGKFDLSGPIDAEGVWSYRLTGLVRDSKTQIDIGKDDRVFIAPALSWKPDADTSLTILGRYQKSKTNATGQTLPANGTLLPNPNGQLPTERYVGEPGFEGQTVTEYSLGYLFEHRIDDVWSLRQNARYDQNDVDAQTVYFVGLDPADPSGRTIDRGSFTGVEKNKSFAIDTNAQARFSTGPVAHTTLVGLDYKRVHLTDAQGGGDAPTLDVFSPIYGAPVARPDLYLDTKIVREQTGLYLQDQLKFDERWVVSLGGRQDEVSTEQTDNFSGSSTKTRDSKFSGRAGVVYLGAYGLSPYASYTESFLPVIGTDSSGAAFKPENGKQYELGIKFQPAGQRSSVSLAAFNLTQANVRTPDLSTANPNDQIQTGKVRSKGLELEALASFDSGLSLSAAYTHQDVSVVSSNSGNEGKKLALVPRDIASLFADYTQRNGVLSGLGFGAGVRYQGETFADEQNTFKVKGFTLADASLHYDLDKLRLQLSVKNLFDKTYVGSCFSDTSCIYGARRNIVASLRYRFD